MRPRICNYIDYTRGASARFSAVFCTLALGIAGNAHADLTAQPAPHPAPVGETVEKGGECLPGHEGFLRARLSGSTKEELNWHGPTLECSGGARPDGAGVRVRFTQAVAPQTQRWVLVFGISGLKEGRRGRTLPANVTLIREGTGEFYSTQGDDKCTVDDIRQVAIVGIPRKTRSYRITARGFCTEPARSLKGPGAILISRFDFEGRLDFESASPDERNVKR
jgi:hypothetical protein